jgi:hypothetical protein
MMKINAVRIGAVLLPLLLSQSYAFAATRDHGAVPHKSAVMHVARPTFRAAPAFAIPSTPPAMTRAPDMSDMWPYYLDIG